MILIKMSCPWGGIFLEGMGEPFFGGDGQNLWGKPGVKIIGGGALSLVSRKKYAVGGGTCIVPYIFCWRISYKSPKLSQESFVLYSNLLISINANHITI